MSHSAVARSRTRSGHGKLTRVAKRRARGAQLSAAIIALNEARQLLSLVSSLQFADEIVLIDGGSTDGTSELAGQLGCRVFERSFDNFAAQRNHAIEQCRGDWILSIDADERPTLALRTEIQETIATRGEGRSAFAVPIRSRIFGRRMRFSGTQDDQPVRLFQREAARWAGDVHERLHVVGKVGRLRSHLEHITLPDLHAFLRKMDRYTTLEAQFRDERGFIPRWRERWLAPVVEFGRRLLWKGGLLDGPEGWAFCALSGFSKWVEADKHRRLWQARKENQRLSRSQNQTKEPIPQFQADNRPWLPQTLLPLLMESDAHE
ncbi:MAG: glycosyltransferase family 2 protein [Pirellulales bacterium]|nr:glycosyltransferase family 2 protein [Pirellulales bacterium]